MLSKWTGKRRKKKTLDKQEKQFVETCLMLATAFRERTEQEAALDPITAKALHNNLSQDLLHQLNVCMSKVSDWPSIPLNKLEKRKDELEALLTALIELNNRNPKAKDSSTIGHPIMTGIVSATVMKLMASDLPAFNENEELVLEALRRSKNSLSEASDMELSNYVQSLSVEQIAGLKNNVKGIYHELAFQSRENLDGDEYIVELFENTNHLGADVRIINIDNRGADADIVESMGIAAMVTLAVNARAMLKGEALSTKAKQKMIQDGVVSASVAGLVQLIL